MPQGQSRDNKHRDDDYNQNSHRNDAARDRDYSDARLRQDDNERGRMNQYSRDDDMNRSSYGQDRGSNQYGDYNRSNRDRDDYQGSRMGGYGRSQSWGGGYNEGGYDQGGTWGSGDRGYYSRQGSDRMSNNQMGSPQTRYGGNRDYPYSGQGSGEPYGRGNTDYGAAYGRYDQNARDRGQQGRNQQHHDHDYMNWRDEQVRKLDDDYDAWRQEKQTKFNSEFESWRGKRATNDPKSSEKPAENKSTTKQ